MDKIGGYLFVGVNDLHEVVVNHPDLKPDKDGDGHIVFSPRQAREFAALLLKHAETAEKEDLEPFRVNSTQEMHSWANEAAMICAAEAHYWSQVESVALVSFSLGAMGAASNICAGILRGLTAEQYAKEIATRDKR